MRGTRSSYSKLRELTLLIGHAGRLQRLCHIQADWSDTIFMDNLLGADATVRRLRLIRYNVSSGHELILS
jgi:hypothetical protein